MSVFETVASRWPDVSNIRLMTSSSILLIRAVQFDMPKDIAEKLRDAIEKSGQSVNSLAKAAGIPQTTLARFMRGHDMGIHRAAVVAKHLGLELKKTNKR